MSTFCTCSLRALNIDPLDLIQHEDVFALSDTASPDSSVALDVNGMLGTRHVDACPDLHTEL